MRFKDGVVWADIHPSLDNEDVLKGLDRIYQRYNVAEAVITSGRDGSHKVDSLHYEGKAIDLRINHVLEALKSDIKDFLGPHFDVILEKDHIHVEFDPKQ